MKVEVVPERPATTTPSTEAQEGGFKLKFCTVCASNNNRYVSLHLPISRSLPQHVNSARFFARPHEDACLVP